jgi:hypothetical protein
MVEAFAFLAESRLLIVGCAQRLIILEVKHGQRKRIKGIERDDVLIE